MNSYQDKDFRVRDRVLLYARGLDLPPAESVEIALKSLERCHSDHPSYAEHKKNYPFCSVDKILCSSV